jgi:acetolactate synthase I/II/III large subunit
MGLNGEALNGAQSLVTSLIAGGVDTCFANPGTSEMHFVAALDQTAGMRCILGLHENVVTGMADGYWRMRRKPACTLLHCGPGLANGFANLHNARRANSGVLNIVGDHATYHRPLDAPLTADTQALARAVSGWVRASPSADQVAADGMEALRAARSGQIATLILPSDTSWNPGGKVCSAFEDIRPLALDPLALDNAAAALLRRDGTLLLLGGDALLDGSLRIASDIAAATGASLLAEYSVARVSRGRGRVPIERIPYAVDAAVSVLASFRQIILVGARPPVSFFAYPDKPSLQYPRDAELHVLTRSDQDSLSALRELASLLRVSQGCPDTHREGPRIVQGSPTPEGFAQMLAAVMPEDAIVSDESISYGRDFYAHTFSAPPHDWLHLTGGAIGDGLPIATGAALGAPGRRVISLQADGSAMYSLQALWTQARERLPCTTIILSNRRYQILMGEYKSVGANPGERANRMLSLQDPEIDWVKIANGMGVEAASATTLERCADLMRSSFSNPDPYLIELRI